MLLGIEQYNRDCESIRGSKFNHDDGFNDRTPGGGLEVAFKQTADSWNEMYNMNYVCVGGMYRGEPSDEYWEPSWVPVIPDPKRWLLPRELSPHDLPCFIGPRHRLFKAIHSGKHEKMADYVFGEGPAARDCISFLQKIA